MGTPHRAIWAAPRSQGPFNHSTQGHSTGIVPELSFRHIPGKQDKPRPGHGPAGGPSSAVPMAGLWGPREWPCFSLAGAAAHIGYWAVGRLGEPWVPGKGQSGSFVPSQPWHQEQDSSVRELFPQIFIFIGNSTSFLPHNVWNQHG